MPSPWSAPMCSTASSVPGCGPGRSASGRLVIAIDGKTVRGAKNKAGRAPHLVAALAHGIGAVLGQVGDLIAVAARTARRGRGRITLHLPEAWHREQEWLNLLAAACGPPAAAA